jgi:hypothetical protein
MSRFSCSIDIERFKEFKKNVAEAKKHRSDFVEKCFRYWMIFLATALFVLALFFTGVSDLHGLIMFISVYLVSISIFVISEIFGGFDEFAEKFPEEQAWIDADKKQ